MIVEQAQVVGGDVEVGVGETDEHSTVDNSIIGVVEDNAPGLSGVTGVVAGNGERRVGDVELVNPSNVLKDQQSSSRGTCDYNSP